MFGIARSFPQGAKPMIIAETMMNEVMLTAREALSAGKRVTVAISKIGNMPDGFELWAVCFDARFGEPGEQLPLFNPETVPTIN